MSDSRALAPLAAGGTAAAIVPRSFDECWRMAQLLAQSRQVPTTYQGKAEDCCVAIMHGLEVGLSPLAALSSIAVINGRPSLWGDGMLAVVRASGLVESFDETDDGDTAICAIKRRGDPKPIVRRFSTADAQKAGLAGKTGPWTQYPQRMRQMRARSWALRDGFADVLKGFYSAEEASDIPARDAPARDITPRAETRPAPPPPPAIPDAPPKAAAPPPIPDVPDAPAGRPQRTDAEFLAAIETDLAACASVDDLLEVIEANKAETDARGLQQDVANRVGQHRVRIHDTSKAAVPPSAAEQQAAEQTYVRIGQAIRAAGTLGELATAWKEAQADLKTLPEHWQQFLAKAKDEAKAKFQTTTGAAA